MQKPDRHLLAIAEGLQSSPGQVTVELRCLAGSAYQANGLGVFRTQPACHRRCGGAFNTRRRTIQGWNNRCSLLLDHHLRGAVHAHRG